jgi:hypothetical protein
MTRSKNDIGKSAIISRWGCSPGSFFALSGSVVMGLLGSACDRKAPRSESTPPTAMAITPDPSMEPPPLTSFDTHGVSRPVALVSDPRLAPWIEEYAAAEREKDRSGSIYRIAEQARLGVPAEQVIAALVDVFSREESAALKSDILGHLTKLRHSSVLPAIARGLTTDQPVDVRLTAIRTFQFLADRETLPFLRRALSDPDSRVREAAQDSIHTLSNDP